MVLQSVVLSNNIDVDTELFYRNDGEVFNKDGQLLLAKGAQITTDTYMNLFDYKTWKKYTILGKFSIKVRYEGKGRLDVYQWSEQERKKIVQYQLNNEQCTEEEIELPIIECDCAIYFGILASDQLKISNISYVALVDKTKICAVHLSLISCTYKRNKEILNNICQIQKSKFYQPTEEIYGKLNFCVVDNGSELKEIDDPYLRLVHNPNTGGSGGFTRGILETRKEAERYGTTHVIFMDDDVLFIEETFYRLYSLLALLKPEYQDSVVSGRMFRFDRKHIQYTASEIWNGGDIIHIGCNLDMRKQEYLLDMNKDDGEYTGWWFGCFPMDFVKDNLPLPFFLHCDDVEYGLRYGGKPIVLNGVQVWHETYEKRITPMIAYYDVRNSMIVNTIYGFFKTPEETLRYWYLRLGYYHRQRDYQCKYAVVVALWDYMKGEKMFLQKTHKKIFINMPVFMNKYITGISRRIIMKLFVLRGEKAFLSYKNILKNYKERM